jgi:hypothetical protein
LELRASNLELRAQNLELRSQNQPTCLKIAKISNCFAFKMKVFWVTYRHLQGIVCTFIIRILEQSQFSKHSGYRKAK